MKYVSVIYVVAIVCCATLTSWAVEIPRVEDPRLKIELFAAEPALVTPTGIAVDTEGRVLVIESHTHFRPQDYKGPLTDRIRRFEDTDGAGRADKIETFFEGTKATMNLAVHHDGSVYVATRSEIIRLRDTNSDGKADERFEIARLDTAGDYPHNGLSGFAFDFAGNVYFSLGENLGADYRLIGADGSTLSGGGEGGSIYRCTADGAELTRIATGFWNPFHLCFDTYENLFAVDNDPDSRPPCRLMHIVPGGDYGYRYRNGRRGTHPFTAWNGELPGTLPMVAGTGEAPSGIICYESDNLPDDYRGALIGTSWGDHRIERFDLKRRGASYRSLAKPMVIGGENFRPVGIALAGDGSLFISDWVDKSYPVHGKGRIWRLSSVKSAPLNRPLDPYLAIDSPHLPLRERAARQFAAAGDGGGWATLQETVRTRADPKIRALALKTLIVHDLLVTEDREHLEYEPVPEIRAMLVGALPKDAPQRAAAIEKDTSPMVKAAAMCGLSAEVARAMLPAMTASPDPFLRQAARARLAEVLNTTEMIAMAQASDPERRVAALLLLRQRDDAQCRGVLPDLFKDADARVRFGAIQWVAESGLREFAPLVRDELAQPTTTRRVFEAALAALERLDPKPSPMADEHGGDVYVVDLLLAPQTSATVRRHALRMLDPMHARLNVEKLREFLGDEDAGLQLEVVRTLRRRTEPAARELLMATAGDDRRPLRLRAEAVAGLSSSSVEERAILTELALGDEAALRNEALRSLRGGPLDGATLSALRRLARSEPGAAELVGRVIESLPDRKPRPASSPPSSATEELAGWLARIDAAPGDAEAGERIYFHPRGPGCYRCHQIDGRGGQGGPDLSTTARVLDRRRLIESIVSPSKEIAPRFVAWTLVLKTGTIKTGVLMGEDAAGKQTYSDAEGKSFTATREEIEQSEPTATSIMPDGMAKTMTPQEFRDLIAYLQQRR